MQIGRALIVCIAHLSGYCKVNHFQQQATDHLRRYQGFFGA